MKRILTIALLAAVHLSSRADFLTLVCGTNKTVNAGTSWTFDPPHVSSSCSEGLTTNYTLTVVSTVTNAFGGCAIEATRTWGASNPCGFSNYCSQTVTVYDAPYLYLSCGSNKTVDCSSAWSFDQPGVASQCDCDSSNYTLSVVSTLTNGTCTKVITRTWLAFNPCGVTNHCSQAVTVVNNNQPQFQGANNITVNSCTNVTVSYNVTASETCCGPLNVTCTPPSGSSFEPGVSPVQCTVTDCCGRAFTNTFYVAVAHTNTPVFQGVGPITIRACGGTNVYFNPTASETCCGALSVACSPPSGSFFGPGQTTVSCTVTDCFGQPFMTSFTVQVMGSTNPPVFDPAGLNNLTYYACASGPIYFGTPSATSGCCSNVNVVCTPASGVVLGPGTTTNIQCVATDCLGDTTTASFQIRVVAPTLQLFCQDKSVNCDDTTWSFDPPGVQLGCCPNTNYTLTGLTPVTNGSCPPVITKTWLIADACGESNQCSQTVTVVNTNQPVFQGASDITLYSCSSTGVFFTVTATEVCCGNLSVGCSPPSGSVFAPGTTQVTCTTTDCCNNAYTTTFNVNVVLPSFQVTCADKYLACSATNWTFDQPTVSDPCCPGTYSFYPQPPVTNGIGCPLSITEVWLVTDTCGNSNQCTETIYLTNQPFACCPESNSVKFVQNPDFSDGEGVLVDAGSGFVLANRFTCTNSGLITDIHLWGGWYYDRVDAGASFTLSILSDDTNGVPGSSSSPGTVLWTQTFNPGDYQSCVYSNAVTPLVTPNGRTSELYGYGTNISYFCFYPSNAFFQTGSSAAPTNYWLSVSEAGPQFPFGWMSSTDPGAQVAVSGGEGFDTPEGIPVSLAFKINTQIAALAVLCSSNKTVACSGAWSFDQPSASGGCCTNLTYLLLSSNLVSASSCQQVYAGAWQVADCCGNSSVCTQLVAVSASPLVPGGVLFSHSGSNNPAAEGWTTSGGDANTFGIAANDSGTFTWFDEDFSTNTFLFYIAIPTAAQAAQGRNYGWNLSTTVRLPNPGQPTDEASVAYSDGRFEWEMSFATTPAGDQYVVLANQNGPGLYQDSGPSYTNSGHSAYHTYDLKYDPATDTADLSVDGLVVLTGYNPAPANILNTNPPYFPYRVGWGTASSPNTGVAGYSAVSFSLSNAPDLNIACATNKTVQCGSPWSFDPPIATGSCCTNLTLIPLSTVTNGSGCNATISRTWRVIDCCSNVSTCAQTVTLASSNAISITCPTNLVAATCGTNVIVTWPTPAASSPCGGVTVTSTPPSGTAFLPNTVSTVTVIARDSCGGSNSCAFSVTVVRPVLGAAAITRSGSTISITWSDGILQQADSVTGPWTDVPGAPPPVYTTSISATKRFYRLRCNSP